MFLNVLSQHLPAAIHFVRTISGDRVLELIYLVELARYHAFRLEKIASKKEGAPDSFNSGTDMKGKALDDHWQSMAAVFELESFLNTVKRALDASWRCWREILLSAFESELKDVSTLGQIIKRIEEKKTTNDLSAIFESCEIQRLLNETWTNWGQEAIRYRNFFEHTAPLGGRTFIASFSQSRVNETPKLILPLPDAVPRNSTKEELTYDHQIDALAYASETMKKLDDLCSSLLQLLPAIECEPKSHSIEVRVGRKD